jgi:hypothetical protein
VTLDDPVRGVVLTALDVDIIADSAVRAVEGDDELTHLSRAVHELELAGMCGPESDTEQGLHAETVDGALLLAERRVKQLLETDESREGST